MGEGDMWQAPGQMRGMPSSSLHPGHRRHHRKASARRERTRLWWRFRSGCISLLPDETCWFLAADFDEESWAADALAVLETCLAKGVPAALERSRSGNGGHVWIFFSEPVSSRTARQLGAAV